MIEANRFLDLLFSVLQGTGLNEIDISEIPEIIKIIYSSKEFDSFKGKLKIEDLKVDHLLKHRFTSCLDEDGVLEFKVDKKDEEEILLKDIFDTNSMQTAINKRLIIRYIEGQNKEKVSFKYDDPDGEYNLPFKDNPLDECETKIFTDGTLEKDEVKDDKFYSKVRIVKVANSTYTIMVDYEKNVPLNAEIRATSNGDFLMVCEEVKNILNGQINSYDVTNPVKPRTYRFKRH